MFRWSNAWCPRPQVWEQCYLESDSQQGDGSAPAALSVLATADLYRPEVGALCSLFV